jgi:L-fuconolactonase
MIDAHVHLWDPAVHDHGWLRVMPALDRRFGAEDLEAVTEPAGVGGAVLVQALADASETEALLALASGSRLIAGVVGWVDLERPDVGEQLERLRELPGGELLVGIRHLAQDEPDPGWLARGVVGAGIAAVGDAGLAYDVLVRPPQLPAAIELAGAHPDVRLVIDHGAKPPIAAGGLEAWGEAVARVSSFRNVTCKLSGLVTEAGPRWTASRIEPYVVHLLECFGPGRLLFGSDWPVCTLAAGYDDVLELARATLGPHLSQAELEAVFGGNATAQYRLAVDAP